MILGEIKGIWPVKTRATYLENSFSGTIGEGNPDRMN